MDCFSGSPDIFRKCLKSSDERSAPVTHFSYCETDFVRRCLSYARKLEMKVKNASVMYDQTEHTFLGQNFLNSPVCFPVAVLWLSVSEGQLRSLKNSGFANSHSY